MMKVRAYYYFGLEAKHEPESHTIFPTEAGEQR